MYAYVKSIKVYMYINMLYICYYISVIPQFKRKKRNKRCEIEIDVETEGLSFRYRVKRYGEKWLERKYI